MSFSQPTARQLKGERLSQVARLLFDDAASNWYRSAAIEFAVGLSSAALVLFDPGKVAGLLAALLGFLLFSIAYALRLTAESKYQLAETMRRQSVLSEALDWDITQTQMGEWERRAGDKVVAKLKTQKRDPEYYATKEQPGPTRLSHMTSESTFYTKHLYGKMGRLLWIITIVSIVVTITVLVFPFLAERTLEFQTMVLLLLPVLMSLDVLGWSIRLTGMTSDILTIERDLESLGKVENAQESLVMRQVNEYNCIVVTGIPVHYKWFKRHQQSIQDAWDVYLGQDAVKIKDVEP